MYKVRFTDHAQLREIDRLANITYFSNFNTDQAVDISKYFTYADTSQYYNERTKCNDLYNYFVYTRESVCRILLPVSANALCKATTLMTEGTVVDHFYRRMYIRNNIAFDTNKRIHFARDTAKSKFVKFNKK